MTTIASVNDEKQLHTLITKDKKTFLNYPSTSWVLNTISTHAYIFPPAT